MPQMKVFVDSSLNLMINIVFPCILLGELVLSPQLTKTKRGKNLLGRSKHDLKINGDNKRNED
jgi:hypothetical protein